MIMVALILNSCILAVQGGRPMLVHSLSKFFNTHISKITYEILCHARDRNKHMNYGTLCHAKRQKINKHIT